MKNSQNIRQMVPSLQTEFTGDILGAKPPKLIHNPQPRNPLCYLCHHQARSHCKNKTKVQEDPSYLPNNINFCRIPNPADQDCKLREELVNPLGFMPPHLPSPFDIEPAAVDDEFVEGFLSSHLCSLSGGKLDESTLLPLHHRDRPDLPKLVKVISVWDKKNYHDTPLLLVTGNRAGEIGMLRNFLFSISSSN